MKSNKVIPAALNQISGKVVDAAYKLHLSLGPGLLESVYEICLAHEIRKSGLHLDTQVVLPVVYDNIRFETGLRLDMVVENDIVVEIKAVESLLAVHEAQLLTYLKLSQKRLGLLLNFNVPVIRQGIKRLVL
jgi:GxxExxY protein